MFKSVGGFGGMSYSLTGEISLRSILSGLANLFSPTPPTPAAPPPTGGIEFYDAKGNLIGVAPRVTVVGRPVGGTGPIRDGSWRGFYTPTGSTRLSNPFSGGPPFGGPIQGSIFGPDNFYGGLDPVAAVGTTGAGPKPMGLP